MRSLDIWGCKTKLAAGPPPRLRHPPQHIIAARRANADDIRTNRARQRQARGIYAVQGVALALNRSACKSVGLAYEGSNPSPATRGTNGP